VPSSPALFKNKTSRQEILAMAAFSYLMGLKPQLLQTVLATLGTWP